jgi:hypothetical protein
VTESQFASLLIFKPQGDCLLEILTQPEVVMMGSIFRLTASPPRSAGEGKVASEPVVWSSDSIIHCYLTIVPLLMFLLMFRPATQKYRVTNDESDIVSISSLDPKSNNSPTTSLQTKQAGLHGERDHHHSHQGANCKRTLLCLSLASL